KGDAHTYDVPPTVLDASGEVHVGLTLDAVRPPSEEEILRVANLTVGCPTADGVVRAVRGVSYSLRERGVLGIVGESGSGKSVSSLAVMGLLPKNARITGSIRFRGEELIGLEEGDYAKIRGNKVAMIFQDPLTSLNPVYSIGFQIAEAV